VYLYDQLAPRPPPSREKVQVASLALPLARWRCERLVASEAGPIEPTPSARARGGWLNETELNLNGNRRGGARREPQRPRRRLARADRAADDEELAARDDEVDALDEAERTRPNRTSVAVLPLW
jgi:hypothetical protein